MALETTKITNIEFLKKLLFIKNQILLHIHDLIYL